MLLPLSTIKGVEWVEGIYHEKSGLWFRDRQFEHEIFPGSYKAMQIEGKVLFDIGANIGTYTRWARESGGAAKVIAFEPEYANHYVARVNTEGLTGIELHHACADRKDAPETEIWICENGSPRCTGMFKRRGRFPQKSRSLNVHRLMREHRAEVLKMDCEGAEYLIGWPDLFPESVREIFMELHLGNRREKETAPALVEAYVQAGWECLRAPKLSYWLAVAHWRR